MKAIILAAGYATRMYPLTKDRLKALLPVGGKVMLDYLMDEIATIDEVDTAYIVTNSRFFGQFSDWAAEAGIRYPRLKLDVLDDGTDSNENRLGAVGDIRFVLDHRHVDDDLLVAASDDFFTFPLRDFVADFRRHDRDTLLGSTSAGWRISSALPWPRWIRTTASPRWWKSRKNHRRMWPSTPSTSTGATPCHSSAAIWTRATPRTPPATSPNGSTVAARWAYICLKASALTLARRKRIRRSASGSRANRIL